MTFAKILVPVTGAPTDSIALETAFAAAKPFQAHVEALFVHPNPRDVTSFVYSGAPIAPQVIQSVIDGQQKIADDAALTVRATLVAVAKDVGAKLVATPAKSDGFSCSLHKRFGFIPHLVAHAARFSDLAVFKPATADERPEFLSAIAETLTSTRKPILLAAAKAPQEFARHVVIAWDGSDAAARAASAALPYLEKASRVEVLTVVPHGAKRIPDADALKAYLAVHGVEASDRAVPQEYESVATSLMRSAAKTGADLVVMGGYGHSHLRETLFGGVTLDVLNEHALPVFLVH